MGQRGHKHYSHWWSGRAGMSRPCNAKHHDGKVVSTKSRVYTLGYPGTKPGCFGHTRACTRVPSVIPCSIFGHTRTCTRVTPEYIPDKTREYPGTQPGCFGHTRACTRVPQSIYPTKLGSTRVPNLAVLSYTSARTRVPPEYKPYQTREYPGTKPGCFGHTRA